MIDILETVERWRAEGQRVALATLVGVEKSAPRDPGSALAVNERGEVAGEVFEQYRIPTYHEASYKPFVISALMFLARMKDPGAKLESLINRAQNLYL